MQSVQTTLPLGILIKGRYLVLDLFSKSSSGAVYLVEDQCARNKNYTLFALKEVINPSKYKFRQIAVEGMSLRLLHHQALPQVYNVISGVKPDRAYILMDYIEGSNLEILRLRQPEKRFPLPLVMAIMAPIMDAVIYLHSQRSPVLHQDIKPANIIVSRGGPRKRTDNVVLVDFGIGKKYNLNSINGGNHRSLTSYEAPEQYSGEITTRSDMYGLGATFYTLLTGIVPTDALSRESKSTDPLLPVNKLVPGVSTLVAECIDCAMSLSCDDRFPTVEQFCQALKADPAWQQSQRLNLRRVLELDLALKCDSSQQVTVPDIELKTRSQPQADTLEQESPAPLLMHLPLVDQPFAESIAASPAPEEQQLPEAEVALPDTPDQPLSVPIVALPDTSDQPLAEAIAASPAPEDQQLPEAEVAVPETPNQALSAPIVALPDTSDQSLPEEAALPETPNQALSEPIAASPALEEQQLQEAEVALPEAPDQALLEPVAASFTLDDQQPSVGALNGMALLTPGALSPPQINHYDYSHLWPDVDIEMSFSQSGCEWFIKTQEQQNNNRRDTT